MINHLLTLFRYGPNITKNDQDYRAGVFMKSLFLFSFCLLFLSFVAPVQAEAGSGAFVHESGWTINPNFPGENSKPVELPPGVATHAPGRQPMPDPTLDEAWEQVWTPIQDLTGVDRTTAENYVEGSQARFRDDSSELMTNAKSWLVIISNLGFGSLAKESVQDWFTFTAADVPTALAKDAAQ